MNKSVLMIIGVILFVLGYASIYWMAGKAEANPDNYVTVCLDKHLYWHYEYGHSLAGKLNDDGTPVKCGVIQ